MLVCMCVCVLTLCRCAVVSVRLQIKIAIVWLKYTKGKSVSPCFEFSRSIIRPSARAQMDTAEQATSLAGTPMYMSPEVLQCHGYGPKADMWALGVVIYEVHSVYIAPINGEVVENTPIGHLLLLITCVCVCVCVCVKPHM